MQVFIDMGAPSYVKRMTIAHDDGREEHFYVTHGSGSNDRYNKAFASTFSNVPESHCTSLGVYTTGETYYGKHGYSRRLDGLTKGQNDNARKRSIVIHAAEYASESYVKANKRCGNSWGCFAVDPKYSKYIIDLLVPGTRITVTN